MKEIIELESLILTLKSYLLRVDEKKKIEITEVVNVLNGCLDRVEDIKKAQLN